MNLDELTNGLAKTELLYLRQMSLRQADANVVRIVPDKGAHAYLVLDRTIFHPKGGGQPSDRGLLHSAAFAMKLKKAIFHQGTVIHWVKIVSGSSTPFTETVTCELDWAYRYRIMRRHTAAHLLDHSLATTTLERVHTTDSWLDDPCYVGYHGEAPNQQTLQKAQDLANTMISTGATVRIDFLSPKQSEALLQSAPNFERLPHLEEIRTVTIAGCTPIPCGGTHVSNIAEIKALTISRAEQMPDQTFRLHFSIQD